MKNIKKIQNSYVERAETPLHDNEELSFGLEILERMHGMRSKLAELEVLASRLTLLVPASEADGCNSVRIPTLAGYKDEPSLDTLRSRARELLTSFFSSNRTVWMAEDVFEAATPKNEPFRALGRQMHQWYEMFKRMVIQPLGLYMSQGCIDPTFSEIFVEMLKRSQADDPIAKEYLRVHWGIQRASELKKSGTISRR